VARDVRGSEVWHVKVDAHKIKEIAHRLGVSERTVEEYLLERLTMQDDASTSTGEFQDGSRRASVIDRLDRPVKEDAG
jgi:DNA-binding NarL/FixJ family response regulator